MVVRLAPGEPPAGPWQDRTPGALLVDLLGPGDEGRRVVAVDGRSGGGKSTLARALVGARPGAALVATDDLAWHAPMFGWADLAREGVLAPFRAGGAVDHRPPAWRDRGREGAITVAPDVSLLVLEGVGAAQSALADLLDAVVWVQSDVDVARRLGIARDVETGVNGDGAQATAFWDAWMADELPFQARERVWERADVVVAGVGEEVERAAPGMLRVARGPVRGSADLSPAAPAG